MANQSSKSGLKRRQAPVDIFTLQPEPELVEDTAEVVKEPVEKAKPRSKPKVRPAKAKTEEPKPKVEEKNIHVSVYVPKRMLARLDELKHRERDRLKKENKRVTRSTLINEAIDRYLSEMRK